jgi:hypothetical protein
VSGFEAVDRHGLRGVVAAHPAPTLRPFDVRLDAVAGDAGLRRGPAQRDAAWPAVPVMFVIALGRIVSAGGL